MSKEIETAATEQLAAMGVAFTARYVGKTKRDGDWECDAWRVKFWRSGKDFETDYFTGLGHRKATKPRPKFVNPRCIAAEQWDRENLKPQTPHAAGVLHSLVLDANAMHESFSDWCANYGYSDDSLSALDTYRACCDIGKQLARIFTIAELDALREALQDY